MQQAAYCDNSLIVGEALKRQSRLLVYLQCVTINGYWNFLKLKLNKQGQMVPRNSKDKKKKSTYFTLNSVKLKFSCIFIAIFG